LIILYKFAIFPMVSHMKAPTLFFKNCRSKISKAAFTPLKYHHFLSYQFSNHACNNTLSDHRITN